MKSVCVVTSNETNKKIFQKILKDNGYTVHFFDKIESFEREKDISALVILDIENISDEIIANVSRLCRSTKSSVAIALDEDSERVLEIIENGVDYCLKKPIEHSQLIQTIALAQSRTSSIVESGTPTEDFLTHIFDGLLEKTLELDQQIRLAEKAKKALENKTLHPMTPAMGAMMSRGEFVFQTIEEGKVVSEWLSSFVKDSATVSLGLDELIVNAIEHGNLGISYEEKSELLSQSTPSGNQWVLEIARRYTMDKYKDKRVFVAFEKNDSSLEITIRDEGEGFTPDEFNTIPPERLFDLHGRGIYMARHAYLNSFEYLGNGNTVKVYLNTNENNGFTGE